MFTDSHSFQSSFSQDRSSMSDLNQDHFFSACLSGEVCRRAVPHRGERRGGDRFDSSSKEDLFYKEIYGLWLFSVELHSNHDQWPPDSLFSATRCRKSNLSSSPCSVCVWCRYDKIHPLVSFPHKYYLWKQMNKYTDMSLESLIVYSNQWECKKKQTKKNIPH